MNGRVRHASWRSGANGQNQRFGPGTPCGHRLGQSQRRRGAERIRFREDTEEHYGRVIEQSNLAHIIGGVSECLVHMGTVIVVGYGGYLTISGGLTAGDVCRFLGYLGIMYGPSAGSPI